MSTYTAEITRDENGAWIARVPSVRGAHTFAKRLDQIAERLAEAISLFTDEDPADIAVSLDVDFAAIGLDDEERDATRQAQALRTEVDAIEARLKANTARAARSLVAHGVSLRDTGALLGISHQRVDQVINERRSTMRIPSSRRTSTAASMSSSTLAGRRQPSRTGEAARSASAKKATTAKNALSKRTTKKDLGQRPTGAKKARASGATAKIGTVKRATKKAPATRA